MGFAKFSIGVISGGEQCGPSNYPRIHYGSSRSKTLKYFNFSFFYMHRCDISLFRREHPTFEQISLFGISEFPYISYTSPYLEFQTSLFKMGAGQLVLIFSRTVVNSY